MMKLSEAMRLGATLKPQAYGWVMRTLKQLEGSPTGTCALGSSLDAIGRLSWIGNMPGDRLWPREWSDFMQTKEVCPVAGCSHNTDTVTSMVITHLNDCHKWTREQIADWVETVEDQVAVPIEEMAVAQV